MLLLRVFGSLVFLASLSVATPSTKATTTATPPAEFTPNAKAGPGGTRFRDYPVYNAPNASIADATDRMLESAYDCFVRDLGWRSTGLSFNRDPEDNTGPYYKLNVYRVNDIPGAAANNTGTDQATGLSFLNVVTKYLTEPSITVHEYGHALTYAAKVWINQTRTGAWWETVAQFVADTFITSPVCSKARAEHNLTYGLAPMMDLKKVLGDSHQAIVDATRSPARGEPSANYYQAWPLWVYLFNNPDDYAALRGHAVFPGVWTQYKRDSDETPLHVLGRMLTTANTAGPTVQSLVGRYWARMAFVDIVHPLAHQLYLSQRQSISYNVLDKRGTAYRVKASRQPRYMGANILPMQAATGATSVRVNVTAAGNSPFAATLAVRSTGSPETIVYSDLVNGQGQAAVKAGDEVALVVANTPGQLLLYDPFNMPAAANKGLDYQVEISGGTFTGGW